MIPVRESKRAKLRIRDRKLFDYCIRIFVPFGALSQAVEWKGTLSSRSGIIPVFITLLVTMLPFVAEPFR
jgi:hypothetical protein